MNVLVIVTVRSQVVLGNIKVSEKFVSFCSEIKFYILTCPIASAQNIMQSLQLLSTHVAIHSVTIHMFPSTV